MTAQLPPAASGAPEDPAAPADGPGMSQAAPGAEGGPSAAVRAAGAASGAPTAAGSQGLAEGLREAVEHRAVVCVTGPDASSAEAAVEACRTTLGTAAVWVRPEGSRDRGALVRALYAQLHLDRRRPQPRAVGVAGDAIAAELQRSARTLVVLDAHRLRTGALELLYGMWRQGRFPLVLAGDDRLDGVLARPDLASLKSCVLERHRLPHVTAADGSALAGAVGDEPSAARPVSSESGAGAVVSGGVADAGTGPGAGEEPEEAAPRWAGLWPMSYPKSLDELRSADTVDEDAVAAAPAAEVSSGPRTTAAPAAEGAPSADVSAAADSAAGALGHVPAVGGRPQGAGWCVDEQDADGVGSEGGAGQAADRDADGVKVAACPTAEAMVDEEAPVAQAPKGSAAPAPAPGPALAGGGGRRRLHGLGDVAGLALTEAVTPSYGPRFGFGLRALDAALGSLPSGVLTLVAAEPHAGGSLLAVHAASHMALTHQLPVLYAASGLSRTNLAMRVIAAEAGVDYQRLRTGTLTPDEQHAASAVQARLAAAALHIDDGSGLTAEVIVETAPYVDGLALVVVDR
ncbi:DnaB-like helicase C-terminal domain-containing protein, partial [Streptomyces sp. NPDC006251]|uniref:DnaB-like helicase C-terminal domain-containing protein n=1 Tax=Streptomyces sp. NPDC006251 TaxID=3155718 RepID=UPI0033A9637A